MFHAVGMGGKIEDHSGDPSFPVSGKHHREIGIPWSLHAGKSRHFGIPVHPARAVVKHRPTVPSQMFGLPASRVQSDRLQTIQRLRHSFQETSLDRTDIGGISSSCFRTERKVAVEAWGHVGMRRVNQEVLARNSMDSLKLSLAGPDKILLQDTRIQRHHDNHDVILPQSHGRGLQRIPDSGRDAEIELTLQAQPWLRGVFLGRKSCFNRWFGHNSSSALRLSTSP